MKLEREIAVREMDVEMKLERERERESCAREEKKKWRGVGCRVWAN
jgi:hypothetical protein